MKNNYKPVKLEVQSPCHQNWNDMTATEQGRFCLSCQKEVIDFSSMTDKEILQYISTASGSTCGKFGSDQLNRDITAPAAPRKIWWKYWMSVAASLILIAAKSNAQVKAPKGDIVATPLVNDTSAVEIVVGLSVITDDYHKREYTVSGVVRDDKDFPVPGATVMIKGTKKGTVADKDGKFSISITDSKNAVLRVSSVGFDMQDVKVENHSNQNQVTINVKLNPVYMGFMGDVVITKRKKKSLLDYFKIDSAKTAVTQVKQLPSAFTIFPNPVTKGIAVKVSIGNLKEGNYRLSVCDIMGNPVVVKEMKITTGSVKESLLCDQRFATGAYVFSLTGNGVNVSSKLLVQ